VKFHVKYARQEALSISLVVISNSANSLKALKPNPTVVFHYCMQKGNWISNPHKHWREPCMLCIPDRRERHKPVANN
jgi:hypothetical protein